MRFTVRKALCYILKDDYDTALETAKKAYDDNGNSLEVIDTLALCAVLKNDDATYSSMNRFWTAAATACPIRLPALRQVPLRLMIFF